MNKKDYIVPDARVFEASAIQPLAGSVLDPNDDNPSVTPSDEEYDGEFGANQQSVWDEE